MGAKNLSAEISAKHELIGRTISTAREQLQTSPGIRRCLSEMACDTYDAYLDRLYIPDMSYGADGRLELSTPDEAAERDLLPVIALDPHEQAVFDAHGHTSAASQTEQRQAELYAWSDGTHSQEIGTITGFIDEAIRQKQTKLAGAVAMSVDPAQPVEISTFPTTYRFSEKIFPGQSTPGFKTIPSRPVLVINSALAGNCVNPAAVAYKADQACDILETGFREQDEAAAYPLRLRGALRGNHVKVVVGLHLLRTPTFDASMYPKDFLDRALIVDGFRLTYGDQDGGYDPTPALQNVLQTSIFDGTPLLSLMLGNSQ